MSTEEPQTRALLLLEEYFPGSRIGGKYRLEEVIGQGGMGSVWRASNVVLEMPVAIKLIRPEVRALETTAWLLDEARLAAGLQHPSVVRIFDFGVAETGDAYIVMELLKGPSLADVLELRGKLSTIAAVRLLLPIVAGLAAAHRKGIAHLDLKPENILIAEMGRRRQPKLLDFGIARRTGRRNSPSERLVGSPAYMSPEQACGNADVDARADIWGICVVLYELVAGRGPFTADTPSDTLVAVREREPEPFLGDEPGLDALWAIVRSGLSKEREHRFVSARHLGNALAQWLIERDVHHDVCGELLAASWGLTARPRTASAQLQRQFQLQAGPRELAPTPAASPKVAARWRSKKLAAAAVCLSVAVPALVLSLQSLLGTDRHARLLPASALDGGISSAPLDRSYETTVAPLTAATRAAEPSAQPAVVRSTSSSNRAAKLSSKRAHRTSSKEAALGLKDPFQ
jgi:eukaryotic-like serine/threonine-protein kinase